MTTFIRTFKAALLGLVAAALSATLGGAPAPLILISLDGCRWDYPDLYPASTPHLRELIATGVSARELIPVYPSNTFPNHYSIATGLYPEHHGIINNDMYDSVLKQAFVYTQPASNHEPRWWGGEPIWTTAVEQGKASSCDFWPGSEVPRHGVRPTYFRRFDYSVPFAARLHDLITRLRLPENRRPVVTTFYFEETNSAGHKHGPRSPEVGAALHLLDEELGQMIGQLHEAGIPANLVIVSDHGMTPVSPDRWMFLDDYLDLKKVQVDFSAPVAGLRPLEGTPEELVAKLVNLPHARAYLARNLPARLQIDPANPRTPAVWIMPDLGWHVGRRSLFDVVSMRTQEGDHGFDPAYRDMHGILIAHGPAFKSDGSRIAPVENVHIYNLMCAVEELKPAPNDGDDRLVAAFLK
jgi:hypothetical protein